MPKIKLSSRLVVKKKTVTVTAVETATPAGTSTTD